MKNPDAFRFLTRKSTSTLFVAMLSLLPLISAASEPAPGKISVMVSILPQVWFVEEIGADDVMVEALVGPGHSPTTFEPTTKQMVRLQAASAFFSAGVPFERGLLPRIAANADAPPVFGVRPPSGSHHGHDHSHGMDPHTWLDPIQAMAMADTIGRVLARLAPDKADLFLSRTADLKTRLKTLHDEIDTIMQPVRGQTFYVFHPAYGHFAKAFGLHQVAVESDGHEPGPRQLAKIIDEIIKNQARFIVVQPQFSKKSSLAIANATGTEILVLDPLARQYDVNLRLLASTLASTLSGKKQ